MMLAGVRSRCTMPRAWAKATASPTRISRRTRSDTESPAVGARVQPLATHKFHHIEKAPVGQRADVVDRNDAGVLELREDAGFGVQARQRRGIRSAAENLHRDVAAQGAVGHAIDGAHAAAPERLHQLVARARQVGQVGDVLEVPECGVRQGHARILTEQIGSGWVRLGRVGSVGSFVGLIPVGRLSLFRATSVNWPNVSEPVPNLTNSSMQTVTALRVRTRLRMRRPRAAGAGRVRGSRAAWRRAGW